MRSELMFTSSSLSSPCLIWHFVNLILISDKIFPYTRIMSEFGRHSILLPWFGGTYNFHQNYLYDFIKNILHYCNDDSYSLLGMCQCQLKAAHPSCIKWWDICQNLHNITCPLTCSKTDDGAGAGYRRPVNIPIYYLKLYPKHNDRHITQTTRSETHP